MLKTYLFKESPDLVLICLFILIIYHKNNIIKLFTLIILMLLILFYRVPNKPSNFISNSNMLYSPAYGTIMNIENIKNNIKISIFLSLFDPHIQYIPYDGVIINQQIEEGNYFFANNLQKSNNNVKLITNMRTSQGLITITQITGFFVRRLVSWVNKGDNKKVGDELGMIKFGSRVDIEFPNTFVLNPLIKIGKKVRGINTILAKKK